MISADASRRLLPSCIVAIGVSALLFGCGGPAPEPEDAEKPPAVAPEDVAPEDVASDDADYAPAAPDRLPLKRRPRTGAVPTEPIRVELRQGADGKWTMLRGGEPYIILGAGGAPERLPDLALHGGNSIRTWGASKNDDPLEKLIDGERMADYAWRHGISICVGIWVPHERHNWDWSDTARVDKFIQESVIDYVEKWKNHPAVLCWGLGNEMEGPSSGTVSRTVCEALERAARIIKERDPNHPVMTVLAGAGKDKIAAIKKWYPSCDILGANFYGGAGGLPDMIREGGWERPWVLAEFGVRGHWEVSKTPWGVPIEQTSMEKYQTYYVTYQSGVARGLGAGGLGSYVFNWGWKQERTHTFYSMFLPSGEKLPMCDAMAYAWSGGKKWPANRCPKYGSVTGWPGPSWAVLQPGQTLDLAAQAADPDGDALQADWEVFTETFEKAMGGEEERMPDRVEGCIEETGAMSARFEAPAAGHYRLFVYVKDGRGGAATANFPFHVKP